MFYVRLHYLSVRLRQNGTTLLLKIDADGARPVWVNMGDTYVQQWICFD